MMLGLLFLALCGVAQDKPSAEAAPGHWPQWRGPRRDGASTEERLLHEWPLDGPPLLWKTQGLGEGFCNVAIGGGLIFTQGNQADKEVVTALDGRGRIVWSVPIGPASGEYSGMRYATQRSPTLDDAALFVTTWKGLLFCLESTTGRILWQVKYEQDLDGQSMTWGHSDSPLVDGTSLICSPGGRKGTLAALNKSTGKVLWRSAELKDRLNSAIVPAEIDGIRQYVLLTYENVAGISASTGNLLWKVERRGPTAVLTTPAVGDGIVFVSTGWGFGANAFQVKREGDRFGVTALYESRQLAVQHTGVVLHDGYVYGSSDRGMLFCLELKTGKVLWENRSVGKGTVAFADGMLVVRSENGPLALVEATPEEYRERGRFQPPNRSKESCRSHPVIAGGRLYLRDQDTLWCYQIARYDYKAPEPVWNLASKVGVQVVPDKTSLPPAEGKAPDAAFVPTPQDVVEKMIELAAVKKDDLLYDLGSGDGRILITASKNHGCKSVGFEINPGLVWESRFKARQAKLEDLITTEEKDLFTVDLSPATVVMLYLGAPNNAKLLPQLRKLKAGARIVSHAHLLGESGPKPDQEVRLRSKEDQEEHKIYVWTAPLAAEKR